MRKATPWLLEQINRIYEDTDLKEVYILSKEELTQVQREYLDRFVESLPKGLDAPEGMMYTGNIYWNIIRDSAEGYKNDK